MLLQIISELNNISNSYLTLHTLKNPIIKKWKTCCKHLLVPPLRTTCITQHITCQENHVFKKLLHYIIRIQIKMYDKVLYEEMMANDDNLESNLLTSSLLKIHSLYKFCRVQVARAELEI